MRDAWHIYTPPHRDHSPDQGMGADAGTKNTDRPTNQAEPPSESSTVHKVDAEASTAGWLRFSGQPRHPGTLREEAPGECEHCGVMVGRIEIIWAASMGAWCVATVCECPDNPWYTRESQFYDTPDSAQAALADIWA